MGCPGWGVQGGRRVDKSPRAISQAPCYCRRQVWVFFSFKLRRHLEAKTSIRLVLLVALGFFLAFGLRGLVVERALRVALRSLDSVSRHLPKSSKPSLVDPQFFSDWPTEPATLKGEPVALVGQSVVGSGKQKNSPSLAKVPSYKPEPKSVRISSKNVLKLALAGVMPQGRMRPPERGMPAGIELRAVAPLGLGLLDGDRLVAVDGVPVRERGQVLQAVLAARVRGDRETRAQLVRVTVQGPQAFFVVVEQPYPPLEAEVQPDSPLPLVKK